MIVPKFSPLMTQAFRTSLPHLKSVASVLLQFTNDRSGRCFDNNAISSNLHFCFAFIMDFQSTQALVE